MKRRKKFVEFDIKTRIIFLKTKIKDGKNLSNQLDHKKIDDDKDQKNGRKNMTMDQQIEKKQPINAFDAANYVIQLYYRCDKEYRCTRSKVEKLLSIAGFIYMARNKKPLYQQNIVTKSCGTGFTEFSGFYFSDIIKTDTPETNQPIKDPLHDLETVKVPLIYLKEKPDLDDDTKELLEKVFLRFGNYAPDKLGKAIDRFKEKIKETSCEDSTIQKIDYNETYGYFHDDANFAKSDSIGSSIEEFINIEINKYEAVLSVSEHKDKLEEMLKRQIRAEEETVRQTFCDIITYIRDCLKEGCDHNG